MGMNIYHLLDIFIKRNLGFKKKGNKGKQKTNLIFWNFKDHENLENRGKLLGKI